MSHASAVGSLRVGAHLTAPSEVTRAVEKFRSRMSSADTSLRIQSTIAAVVRERANGVCASDDVHRVTSASRLRGPHGAPLPAVAGRSLSLSPSFSFSLARSLFQRARVARCSSSLSLSQRPAPSPPLPSLSLARALPHPREYKRARERAREHAAHAQISRALAHPRLPSSPSSPRGALRARECE